MIEKLANIINLFKSCTIMIAFSNLFDKISHETKRKETKMQLMTVTEVSEILKVRKETVYSWIKQGELACIRLDKLVRVDERDLVDFINKHKQRRTK